MTELAETRNDGGYVVGVGGDEARFQRVGARLTSLILGGHELILPDDGAGEVWWGGFPMVPFLMVPWTGLLQQPAFHSDNRDSHVPTDCPPRAMHGLLRDVEFATGEEGMSAGLPASGPFGGAIAVRAWISEHTLHHSITVRAADAAMPVTLGWHPWFRRNLAYGGAVEITIPDGAELLEREWDGMPAGAWTRPAPGPYDECFRTESAVRLTWPGAGTLSIDCDGGFLSIYSGNERGIVVEPQNGPSDQLVHRSSPGASLTLNSRFRWEAQG
jgi:aldose 1-epimerase